MSHFTAFLNICKLCVNRHTFTALRLKQRQGMAITEKDGGVRTAQQQRMCWRRARPTSPVALFVRAAPLPSEIGEWRMYAPLQAACGQFRATGYPTFSIARLSCVPSTHLRNRARVFGRASGCLVLLAHRAFQHCFAQWWPLPSI